MSVESATRSVANADEADGSEAVASKRKRISSRTSSSLRLSGNAQAPPEPTNLVAACFDKRGEHVYTGHPDGRLLMHDVRTHAVVREFSVYNSSPVRSLVLSRQGKHLLVNTTDKALRVYNLDTLEVEHEFKDRVSGLQWRWGTFSPDAEYVIAGSAQKAEHNIYVWSRAYGQLKVILEGPKEGILFLNWHPTRPVIASCSTSGVVYIWGSNQAENWSAYAPDFKELEENIMYKEREDEFDLIEEEVLKAKEEAQDIEVDVVTIDKDLGSDSSDDEDHLWFLPTIPQPDPPPMESAERELKYSSSASSSVITTAPSPPL